MKKPILPLFFTLISSSCFLLNNDLCGDRACTSDETCRTNSDGVASCSLATCGDEFLDSQAEECDASDSSSAGSLCDATCHLIPVNAGCGDGIQDPNSYCLGARQSLAFFEPNQATTLDIDQDGDLDLFVISGDSTARRLEVYTFEEDHFELLQTVPASGNVAFFQALDFDQDQDPDLIVRSENGANSQVQVFFNHQNNFDTSSQAINGEQILAVTDINADGALDIAVPDLGGSHFFLASPDGTFAPGPLLAGVSIQNTADLNNDGLKDALAVNQGRIEVSLQNSQGAFLAPIVLPDGLSLTGFDGVDDTTLLRDWDNDGDVDLLATQFDPETNLNSRLVLLINPGDGSLSLISKILDFPLSSAGSLAFNKIDVRDWDNDGDFDIMFGVLEGQFTLMQNQGGTFLAQEFVAGPSDIENGSVGDFNGDGLPDVVVLFGNGGLSGNSTFSIFENLGDGQLQESLQQDISLTILIRARDFNGDGRSDLHFLNSTDAILLNQETEPFQEVLPIDESFGDDYQDLNGDGFLDLFLTSNSEGFVAFRLGGLD